MFSPWTTVRDDRGTVYFAGGLWTDAAGRQIPAPASLAYARAMAGDVVSPEGDNEKIGGGPSPSSSSSAPVEPAGAHP
jgi:hypothetical protein